jgi:hypothetical protein
MKISVINTGLSPAAARHAEVRAWLATQRFQERVSWLTVWLRKAGAAGAVCRMEAWVSGIGVVTGEHRCPDPVTCVEIAAARLKHSAMRRLKARWQAPRRWRARGGAQRGGVVPTLAGASA